jgi:3-oxoadipate enol-lactonase
MALIEIKRGVVDVEQDGKGRNLVLLHSLLAERSAFDRVRPPLSKSRRLWLLSLPGYGRSTPMGATIEDYADHVAELMRVLNLSRETDILGNGLGGFIALALAIHYGDKFDRLIIIDSLAAFPEAGKEPLRALAATVQEKGMAAALDTAILRMFPMAYIQAHPDVVSERKRALLKMDPVTFSKLCIALTKVDFEPALSGIRNRALVMVGEKDGATPPELASKLASGIPQAHFVQIPNCGHCPQIEQPETFLAVLNEFLSAP